MPDYSIHKYVKHQKNTLHAAFVNLKADFNSISRGRLLAKVTDMSIDKRLLLLLINLHGNNWLQIRLIQDAKFTKRTSVQKRSQARLPIGPPFI